MDACKCDKMFSERLADVSAQCNADLDQGITDSPFCIDEEFRTQTGGGTFDPFDNTSGKNRIDYVIDYTNVLTKMAVSKMVLGIITPKMVAVVSIPIGCHTTQ